MARQDVNMDQDKEDLVTQQKKFFHNKIYNGICQQLYMSH